MSPMIELLDHLPESITQPPARIWSVLARSLGEQGADGRTALAWRWAMTGACPSPVTLGLPQCRTLARGDLLAEAAAKAELTTGAGDPGGQVMHARLVLEWLVGEIDAVPLWNAGPGWPHITDGAAHAHDRGEIEEVYGWALRAVHLNPAPVQVPTPDLYRVAGWAYGTEQLLRWVCGETDEGPLTGLQVPGRPSLYQVSLDTQRAMSGVRQARESGKAMMAARMEAMAETFLWLAGWRQQPPVEPHGRMPF